MNYILEHNLNEFDLKEKGIISDNIAITPTSLGDDDYFIFRIKLSENQAIIAFPKFFTVGIGFQKEEDWNTNLPWTSSAKEIFNHIKHNKGDKNISDYDCVKAIEIIQESIKQLLSTLEG